MKNKQFLFFSVFKRYISLVRQNEALCGNGLNNVACSPIQSVITRRQNFRLVQIETNCRQHYKVHLK